MFAMCTMKLKSKIGQDKEYDIHNDDRIKYLSSLKAQEDFRETEVAEDAL